MNNIDWLYDEEEEDDGTFDLVGYLNGKYVDVVQNYKGKWSVLYNNVRVRTDIGTREEAKTWAEKTDLIEALSECCI